MSNIDNIKSQLVRDMWLVVSKQGADYFISKHKKNKGMKVLSLTSPSNYGEIDTFLQENLTERVKIVAWNNDFTKIVRLETELGDCQTLGPTRYEYSISDPNSELATHFPFHIINLDFSSQDPLFEEGRLEREISSVEKTIQLQKQHNIPFVLLFTTIINGNCLDVRIICDESDGIRLRDWPGICIDPRYLDEPVQNLEDKMLVIECILNKFSQKHGFSFEHTSKSFKIGNDANKKLFSIGAVLRSI